jgi:hypothetical protein
MSDSLREGPAYGMGPLGVEAGGLCLLPVIFRHQGYKQGPTGHRELPVASLASAASSGRLNIALVWSKRRWLSEGSCRGAHCARMRKYANFCERMLEYSSSPSARLSPSKILCRLTSAEKRGPSHTNLRTATHRQRPKILSLRQFFVQTFGLCEFSIELIKH